MTNNELITIIQDKRNKQADIIRYYCQAMTDHLSSNAFCDWRSINAAIMDRWSRSGLQRIKTAAWTRLEEKRWIS